MKARLLAATVVLLLVPLGGAPAMADMPERPREPRKPRVPRTPDVVRDAGGDRRPGGTRLVNASPSPAPAPTAQPGPPGGSGAPNAAERGSTPRPGAVPEWPWGRLADCESGNRENGRIIPGTRRWHLNVGTYDGGLQFLPSTWRDAWRVSGRSGPAGYAYQHPAHVQVDVARAWLAVTSWRQWPDCSRRLGLR